MIISMIAAIAENGVIGDNGKLPWHLPADLRRFKEVTMGHPIVMGHTTFRSLNRVLPGRRHVVLSRDPEFLANHPFEIEVVPGIPEARAWVFAAGFPEMFVIGGAETYRQLLPMTKWLYLTRVNARPNGDTLFPPIDFTEWAYVSAESRPKDDKHEYSFSFELWKRRDAKFTASDETPRPEQCSPLKSC